MGYSISSRFKTVKERERMISFLESHYSLVEELRKYDQFNTRPMDRGEDLGYAPKCVNKLVGFGATQIHHSMWSLCAWMAVKSKYRLEHQPIIYYDEDVIPITVNLVVPKKFDLHFNVDMEGIVMKRPQSPFSFYRVKYAREIKVMTKINEAWIQFK